MANLGRVAVLCRGNLVYLGFHPYFVFRPQFRSLVQAVLTDFGEFPIP